MRLDVLRLAIAIPAVLLLQCSSDATPGGASATTDGGSTIDGDGGTVGTDGGSTTETDGGTPSGGDGGSSVTAQPVRSAGCGKAAKPSPVLGDKRTIKVGTRNRTFLEYIPAGYDPNKNYPLVFTLHGIGATGAEMAEYIMMQDYVSGGAVVVFPDAVNGNWDTGGNIDLDFHEAMIDAVGDRLCLNQQRVYALGFSYGAYMVNHLGCKRPSRIRAIVAANGGFGGSTAGCGQTSALVYHRTDDDDESVVNGRNARDKWVAIDKCTTTTKAFGTLGCVEYQGCAPKTVVAWCEDKVPAACNGCKHDLRDVYRVPLWQWMASQQ